MRKFSFTIPGNADNAAGNPLPKLKMIGSQRWTPKALAYGRWKEHVQIYFYAHYKPSDRIGLHPIVLEPGERAHMDIFIHWGSRVHGDPENVFGSIADALFENDKHLSGSFDFEYSPDGWARVEVSIVIKPGLVEPGKTRGGKRARAPSR